MKLARPLSPGTQTEALIYYAKDQAGVLPVQPSLRRGYRVLPSLPAGAIDTGFRNGRYSLWYPAAGDAAIYLAGTAGRVEVWPKVTEPFGCL